MRYYLVLWHDQDQLFSGYDLVYATSKREARSKLKAKDPQLIIDAAITRTEDDADYFEEINPEEFNRAKHGEVIRIQEAT